MFILEGPLHTTNILSFHISVSRTLHRDSQQQKIWLMCSINEELTRLHNFLEQLYLIVGITIPKQYNFSDIDSKKQNFRTLLHSLLNLN